MSIATASITSLEAVRAGKEKRMEEITTLCAEEDRTKNETEREEFDTLRDDIRALDAEIRDAKDLEAIQKRTVPVNGNGTEAASKSRETVYRVAPRDNPEKGIQFARLAMALAKSKGDPGVALNILKAHYPQHPAVAVLKAARDRGDEYGTFIAKAAEMRTKADVPAGSTTDETWAGPLLAHNDYTADFIEYLRPRTILGRFGEGGVPSLRRIPFNVHIKGQSTGGSGHWVGEGQTKPVTKFDYLDAYHGFTKVAGISVLTEELIRFSDPSAETLVRDGLASALIARMDTDFVDATAASGVRPAGIRQGVTPIPSSGSDVGAIMEDIAALWADADDTDLPQDSAVYIMRPTIARRLGLLRGEIDNQKIFNGVSARGGMLEEVPIITSNYAPAGTVILVFASEVYLSDDGVVTVDASREASIQMVDTGSAATNASTDLDDDYPAPVPTTLVSMYQTDSVALRAHRFVHWSKRRTNAVQVLSGVEWGVLGS
jgi:HK97 family phage major capsid protein